MKLILNEHKPNLSSTYLVSRFKKYRFAYFCSIVIMINFIKLSNTPENSARSYSATTSNSNQIPSDIFAYTFGLQQNRSFEDSKTEICMHVNHLFEKAPYTSNRIMIIRIFDDFSRDRAILIKKTLSNVKQDLQNESQNRESFQGIFNENKAPVSILELTLDEFLLLFGMKNVFNSKCTNHERINSIKNSLFCQSINNKNLTFYKVEFHLRYLILELKCMDLLIDKYEDLFERNDRRRYKTTGFTEIKNLTHLYNIKVENMLLGKLHLNLCNYIPAQVSCSKGDGHMINYLLVDKKEININDEQLVTKRPRIISDTSESVYIKSYNDFYELFPANYFKLYKKYSGFSIHIKNEEDPQHFIIIEEDQEIMDIFGRKIIFRPEHGLDKTLIIIFKTIKKNKNLYREVIIYNEYVTKDVNKFLNLFEIRWNIDTNYSEMDINKVEQEDGLIVLNRFVGHIYDCDGWFLFHKLLSTKSEYSTCFTTNFFYVLKYNFSEISPNLASTTFAEKTERIENIKDIIMSLDSSILKLQIYQCEMDYHFNLEEEKTNFDGIFGINFKHFAQRKKYIFPYLESKITMCEEFVPTEDKDLMIKFDCKGQNYFFFVKYENSIIEYPTIDYINDDTLVAAFLNVFRNESEENARKMISDKYNTSDNKTTTKYELYIELFFELINQIELNELDLIKIDSFEYYEHFESERDTIIDKAVENIAMQNDILIGTEKMQHLQARAMKIINDIYEQYREMPYEQYKMIILTDKLGDAPIFKDLEDALYKFKKKS